MTWQYRVMCHRYRFKPELLAKLREANPDQPEYSYYTDIREVYYKDGAPKASQITPEWVEGWSADSSAPVSTKDAPNGPLQGIVDDLRYYMLAMSLPILNEWELPGYKGDEATS